MAFQEVWTGTCNRGERTETGFTFEPGQAVCIVNENFTYGQVQQWGVLLAKGENDVLGGNPVIYQQELLFHKAHAVFCQNWIGQRLELAIYVPVTYPEPDVDVLVGLWTYGDD